MHNAIESGHRMQLKAATECNRKRPLKGLQNQSEIATFG